MKTFSPVMLALSLVVNIALGVLLYMGPGMVEPEEPEISLAAIKTSGVHGPEGIRVVEGDATISAPSVVLQNTLITGNLVVTKEIGDGRLELKNVTVQGSTLVNGGSESSIFLTDSTLAEVVVNHPQSRVKIVAAGNTTVSTIILETGALLEERQLTGDAAGFMEVEIHTEEEVDLVGRFSLVTLETVSRLLVRMGRVDRLQAERAAKDSYIEFFEQSEAGRVDLAAAVEIAGVSRIEEIDVRGVGLTRLAGTYGSLWTGGPGIFVEIEGGQVDSVTVDEGGGTVSLHVAADSRVGRMELQGKTAVTGQGTIEYAFIGADGTTMARAPELVELAPDITAVVEDRELPEKEKDEPKPEPKPTPDPEPAPLPRVSIGSITSISSSSPLFVEESATRDITVNPANASITARSSNTSVAQVSVSGSTVTITATGPGASTISVTGRKSGYRDRTVSFTVAVVRPTTVKSFSLADGLSPGKKLVMVEIWAKDPQNYSVKVKGTTLMYLASEKVFSYEVDSEDAKENNVTVYPK